MRIRRFIIQLALIILVFTSTLSIGFAQENTAPRMCPCPEEYRHVLGGHGFLPSFIIPSPFADSQATVALGLGVGSYNATLFGSEREFKLGAFQPLVEGQVLVLPGFAIHFGVSGNVVTGINTEAVLDYGASVSYSFLLGGIYEFLRNNSDVLSGSLDVSRPHTLALSPLDAVQSGIESTISNGDPDFASDRVTTRWFPSLRFAHTFASFIGLQSILGLRIDDETLNTFRSAVKTSINFGLGFSSDFKELINFPLGATVNYRRLQVTSSNQQNSDQMTFGLFETISKDFNFGLELGFANTGPVSKTIAALTVKVYYQ